MDYRNLDQTGRQLMLAEIERDIANGTLYLSDNLNPRGKTEYPSLLKAATREGTDVTLATEILGRLNSHEKPRQLKSGALSKPPIMRSNAHEMLAEGEFNRFYIRAICLRAIENGAPEVIVYRAKEVQSARPESTRKIGKGVPAEELLRDLRTNQGIDTALGLPPGPNSGLSLHLP